MRDWQSWALATTFVTMSYGKKLSFVTKFSIIVLLSIRFHDEIFVLVSGYVRTRKGKRRITKDCK